MGLRRILNTGALLSSLALFSCGPDPVEPPVTQPANRAPQITSTCPTQIEENILYQCQVQASDPDGDNLSYKVIQSPSWLDFIGVTNSLFGRAPEVSEDERYAVEFQVRDVQGLGTNQSFTLTVQNVSNTHILNPETSTLSQVNDGSLVFDEPVSDFSVGDIIVSDTSSYAPSGFLREVISISSDGRTLQTGQSTLEEAIGDGSFSFRESLSPGSSSISGLEGISMASPAPGFNFGFNFEDVVLYDEDGNLSTTNDQIVANGRFSFNAELAMDLEIGFFKLKYFLSKVILEESSELILTSGLSGNFPSKDIKIGEFRKLPKIRFITPSGFPIVIKPEIEFYAGIDFGLVKPLEVRISQEANLEAGVIYDGDFRTIFNFSNTFGFSVGTSSGDFNLKPFVRPNLNFLVYDIGGPSLAFEAGLRFKSEGNRRSLHGTLGFLVGADLEIFGFDLPGSPYLVSLPEHEELLWEEEIVEPPRESKILFASRRSGNPDIWMMDTDGSNHFQVTSHVDEDYDPSWSPDGEKLTFVSNRSGNANIYMMNIDGSNIQRLTYTEGTERYPSWSPDGSQIVFFSSRNGENGIFLMNADGTNQRRLNFPAGTHRHPSWSPDGSQIVFSSRLAGEENFDIYKVNLDGTELERLTVYPYEEFFPSWSPDGTKIMFSSREANGNSYSIFTMNADGSDKINLSNAVADTWNLSPSWSPDGGKIVYSFNRIKLVGESGSIWIMDSADGGNKIRLSENISYADFHPTWSPF